MTFVALIGVVSLFADMTYEGARSINGPFLAVLGASSLAVGFIAGAGELLGYLTRPVSGAGADRTGRYWTIILAGYSINLLAVPALALAGNWPAAAALMIAERLGKGIRNPPRDVILSAAGSVAGQGWVFGFHEAMDQIGATLGPLIVALILFLRGTYHQAYALLLLPAAIAIGVVIAARFVYPHPERFEVTQAAGEADRSLQTETNASGRRFPSLYWIYVTGVMFVAAGFADYPLIAYHFHQAKVVSPDLVPVLYAVAMATDAAAALAFGALFDRIGSKVMVIGVALSLFFAPLVFGFAPGEAAFVAAFVGMALWGIGMGAHESVMSAIVARIIPFRNRGRAYGVFNAAYGGAWFAGSAVLGYLYGVSVDGLIIFSMAAQAASLPFLVVAARRIQR